MTRDYKDYKEKLTVKEFIKFDICAHLKLVYWNLHATKNYKGL